MASFVISGAYLKKSSTGLGSDLRFEGSRPPRLSEAMAGRCATGLLAEYVVASSNGHGKPLKSEVTFSEQDRYGPEMTEPDGIVSWFSKI